MRRQPLWVVLFLMTSLGGAGCRCDATAPNPDTQSAATEPPPEEAERSRPPNPVVVDELIVRDLTTEGERAVDLSSHIDASVKRSLAATDRLRITTVQKADDAYSLGVGVGALLVVGGVRSATLAKGVAVVIVRMELGRAHASGRVHSGGLAEEYVAEVHEEIPYDPATDGSLDALLRPRVDAAVDHARDRLVAQLNLAGGTDDSVRDLLKSDDPWVRAAAARETGDRSLKGATHTLTRLLRDDDGDVRLAALGALGRLGDPGTVPSVARLTRGMNIEENLLAIAVLGDIGGAEARRYLETLAYSHPREAMRQAANAALARAKEKEKTE